MTTNTDALNNPNYNPDMDETTIALYNLMDEPSDELIAQYREIFDNLPKTNPYSGVLINPNTCVISDISNTITSVISSLNDPSQYPTTDPTYVSQVLDTSNPDSVVSQLTGGNSTTDPTTGVVIYVQPDSVTAATTTAQDHSDTLLSNLPMILGIVQQALGLATALEGLLNPCLGMSDFLGSLMGAMEKILKAIQAAIAAIEGALEDIMAAIAYVMNLVKQLLSFIESEIMKLIMALINAMRAGLAAFLKSLGNDPCLSSLVGGITTMAATAIL